MAEAGKKGPDWVLASILFLVALNVILMLLSSRSEQRMPGSQHPGAVGPGGGFGPGRVGQGGAFGPPGGGQGEAFGPAGGGQGGGAGMDFGPGNSGPGSGPGGGPAGPFPPGGGGPASGGGTSLGLLSASDYIAAILGSFSSGDLKLGSEQKSRLAALISGLPDEPDRLTLTFEVISYLNTEQKMEIRNHINSILAQAPQSAGQASASLPLADELLAYLEERGQGARATPALRVTLPSQGGPPLSQEFVLRPRDLALALWWLKSKGGRLEPTPQQAAGIYPRLKVLLQAEKLESSFGTEVRKILSQAQINSIQAYALNSNAPPDPSARAQLLQKLQAK